MILDHMIVIPLQIRKEPMDPRKRLEGAAG